MPKLFLLDALALIFRAYHALANSSPRKTSNGYDTNAQFGFTNTIIDLLIKENPSHIVVCFDTHAPTVRHIEYEQYKAQRQEAPEALIQAIPDIKEIISAFNVEMVELDGYEADDVIGTLAYQAADKGFEVFMVTSDKDYGQLLTKPNIYIYKPAAYGNPPEIITAEKVCQKWDIQNVHQVIDILGLMGDAVDNIPGIKGVGEKTAAKLLKEFGSVEEVINQAANIKGALGDKIRAGKEDAILSKKLATIITDVPVEFNTERALYKGFNQERLQIIFQKLEFKTLGKRLFQNEQSPLSTSQQNSPYLSLFPEENKIAANPIPTNIPENSVSLFKHIKNTEHDYILIETASALQELVDILMLQKEICIDTETTGIHPKLATIIGLAFSYQAHQAYYISFLDKNLQPEFLHILEPLWDRTDVVWIAQNLKYDWLILKNIGIHLKGQWFDTMVAHFNVQPEGKHNMDSMSEQYLQYSPISIESLIGKKGKNQGTLLNVPLAQVAEYSAEDADITFQLKQRVAQDLIKDNVENIFYKIDNPLVKVLVDMEDCGIRIDTDFLNNYAKTIDHEAKQIEELVVSLAGIRFNLSSPKQVGEVLFQKLNIDNGGKKTATGQLATGEEVLIKLAKQHPIVQHILDYRELTKLLSTYIVALPEMVNPQTGRVHTSYGQTVAVTGRLNSNYPNLQNIPIRTKRGQEIRKSFIAPNRDWVLVSADYSQIELRIMAALSGDKNMIQAFIDDKDIHLATAAKIFYISEEQVTKEQRYQAKSVNFGLLYGQGVFGLAENLNISRSEAKIIVDNYKQQFNGMQDYIKSTIEKGRVTGYVETYSGRKRYLPDLNSQNFTIKSFAERNAINSPIQGTAADMIKLAMIKIHQRLEAERLQSKMLLQVHDELVFEVPLNELEYVQKLILNEMENALPLPNGVPVKAGIGFGANWLEAH
ncbi:MAG: DNA polymerase I [Sediminibacterium sp.]|nr:DNA polymerase I [Sediminibacterium sp.]